MALLYAHIYYKGCLTHLLQESFINISLLFQQIQPLNPFFSSKLMPFIRKKWDMTEEKQCGAAKLTSASYVCRVFAEM